MVDAPGMFAQARVQPQAHDGRTIARRDFDHRPARSHVRIGGDTGHPVAIAGPEDKYGGPFYTLAKAVIERAREASAITGPTMTVSD